MKFLKYTKIICVFLLCLCTTQVQAQQDNEDVIALLTHSQQVQIHQQVTQAILKLEERTLYPLYNQGSRFSSVQFLDKIFDVVFPQLIASDQSNLCLFGGWPSHRQGLCHVPWSSPGRAVSQSRNLTSYGRDNACGHQAQFRCNPHFFGPGLAPELVPESMGRVNGHRNNTQPYQAGICVDISQGYEGLSRKCHEASQQLDQIRKDNNLPEWRESEFFRTEVVDALDEYRGIINNVCTDQSHHQASTYVCNSLNEALSLNFTANRLREIATINDEECDDCEQYAPREPVNRCLESPEQHLSNTNRFMERLQSDAYCRFSHVQAIDEESLGQLMGDLDAPTCAREIASTLGSRLSQGPTPSAIYFYGHNGERLGQIRTIIDPNLDASELVSSLQVEASEERYGSGLRELCNLSSCPREVHPELEGIYAELEELQADPQCNFGRLQLVDIASQSQEHYSFSNCRLSIGGELASEGLEPWRDQALQVGLYHLDASNQIVQSLPLELRAGGRLNLSADQKRSLCGLQSRFGMEPDVVLQQEHEDLLSVIEAFRNQTSFESLWDVSLGEDQSLQITGLEANELEQLQQYLDFMLSEEGTIDLGNKIRLEGNTLIIAPSAQTLVTTLGDDLPDELRETIASTFQDWPHALHSFSPLTDNLSLQVVPEQREAIQLSLQSNLPSGWQAVSGDSPGEIHIRETPTRPLTSTQVVPPVTEQVPAVQVVDVPENNFCQNHFQNALSQGVNPKALRQALSFYQRNQEMFDNPWISIADYTRNSRERRYHMVNVDTGEVRSYQVSHGSGSVRGVRHGDPNHNGMLDRCTHPASSGAQHNRQNMTRGGFFRTEGTYRSPNNSLARWPAINPGGTHNGVILEGLTEGVNHNARRHSVVMHGAHYNRNGGVMGRSFGCPAFRPQDTQAVLGTINRGALVYSYVGDRCQEDQNIIDESIPDWELMCDGSASGTQLVLESAASSGSQLAPAQSPRPVARPERETPEVESPTSEDPISELAPATSLIPAPRPEGLVQAVATPRPIGEPAREYRSSERGNLVRQIIAGGPDAFATTRVQINGSCFEVMNDSPTLADGTYVPFTYVEAEQMARQWGWQIPNLPQARAIRQFAEREGVVFPAITRSNDTVAQREASIGHLLNDINVRGGGRVGDMRSRAEQGRERLVNGHFKWYVRHNNQYQIYGFRGGANGYYQLNPSGFHSSQSDYVDYSHGVRLLRPCP
jgi:hypothetical protein